MTNIPAPGAVLATERLRDLLTAAGNASFECGAHDCDGDAGDPAPYAELARIAAEKRAEIVEFFRASFAAVPASEPVACSVNEFSSRMCESGIKGCNAHHAAPAPVSGMPDLASLLEELRDEYRSVVNSAYCQCDSADDLLGRVSAALSTDTPNPTGETK